MKKQVSKTSYTLLLTATVLLICFSVGVVFCAFYDYRSGSSGAHTINKLGYIEVTANINDQPVYPGASFDASFTIKNSVKQGYGTLPIVVENIEVLSIQAKLRDDTLVNLSTGSSGVVQYVLDKNSIVNTVIQSGQTADINFNLTIKSSATYDDAFGGIITEDSQDYLINQTQNLVVTFRLLVEEEHTITT